MKFPTWYRCLVAVTFLLFVVNFYVFLRVSPHLVDRLIGIVSFDKLASALGSLVGTFVGAWLAFRFANSARSNEGRR